MAELYRSNPGTLIKTSISKPTFVSVTGLSFGDKMVATNFKLDRSQEVQHQRTLSQDIYTYAFGESVGRIQLGGLLFFGDCSGPSAEAIGRINNYYTQNNLFAKKGAVTCTVGSSNSFKCYLENLSVVAESGPFNIGSFNLGFTVLPAGSGGREKGLHTGGLSTSSL